MTALRAIGAVLVVAGHVIGNDARRGMQVPDRSGWRYLYLALADLPMPLFTLVAGYVYALRPTATAGALGVYTRARARRLLVPLLTVGTVLFATKTMVPGTNTRPAWSGYWRVFVFPYEHLWYLQAIFVVSLLAAALDVLGLLTSRRSWGTVLVGSLLLYATVRVPLPDDVFMVDGVLRLLPFFLLGLGMHRHGVLDLRGRQVVPAVALLAVLFCLRMGQELGVRRLGGAVPARTLAEGLGIAAVVVVFALRRLLCHPWLVRLGAFSFAIFLLHVFGTAASRLALRDLGVRADLPVFVVGLAVGVAAPVVFTLATRRSRFLRTAVLGERFSRSTSRRPPRWRSPRSATGTR